MIQFEGMERRMARIEACLRENGLDSLEAAEALCKEHGIDVAAIVKGVQPIAFENAVWAYTLGTAIALKKGAAHRCRCSRGHWAGAAGLLRTRFGRRPAQGGPGPWQPGCHAAPGGDQVLLLPGRP